MAQQGEVIGFERRTEGGVEVSYSKVDAGGGDVEEVQHLDAPGDDSQPLPGDFASFEELGKSGTKHSTGYHDPKTPQKAGPGERRLYARDSAGTTTVECWLKADGTLRIEVFKSGGPIEIVTEGTVKVESPRVLLGKNASRGVACEGDFVVGAVRAICGAPGSPLIPVPPATPTPTGGVPFAGQIVSGRRAVKAGDG